MSQAKRDIFAEMMQSIKEMAQQREQAQAEQALIDYLKTIKKGGRIT